MLRQSGLVLGWCLFGVSPVWGLQVAPGGVEMEVLSDPPLRIFVPKGTSATLSPVVRRAGTAYRQMAREAGYADPPHLELVLADDSDNHNGFSTVVPLPMVLVWMAPAPPESTIFGGDDHLMRTLVHEFAHHLANERAADPIRQGSRWIFGRVLPNEPLSLLTFFLTAPGHVTQPPFWHEGTAQWAETTYAATTSPWAGRGRDPLVHMMWRIQSSDGHAPDVDTWRLTYQRWPYGSQAYLYGLAYTRWLSARMATKGDIWQCIAAQSDGLPFDFDRQGNDLLGQPHHLLIAEMRRDLAKEQADTVAKLTASGALTLVPRWTSPEIVVGAPAWLPDGRLIVAGAPRDRQQGLWILTGPGQQERVFRQGPGDSLTVRAMPDGRQVFVRQVISWIGERRKGLSIRSLDGSILDIQRKRLLQADAAVSTQGTDLEVCGVVIKSAGETALVRARVDDNGAWHDERVIAMEPGTQAWSPVFSVNGEDLAYVETSRSGSRLMVMSGTSPARALWAVPARILHPAWGTLPDGSPGLFVSSDVSGVANAWFVPLTGVARPVTHSKGGITAAVPSPDGTRLALLEHDLDGPYVGVIPLDTSTWPSALPEIQPVWPAPGPRGDANAYSRVLDNPEPGPELLAEPYAGLGLIRPRFISPTTLTTPYGGIGVVMVASDPLGHHQIVASIGQADKGSTVGRAWYTYGALPIELSSVVDRSEIIYDGGSGPDLVEIATTYEIRAGRGTGYFSFGRFAGYVAAGRRTRESADEPTPLGFFTGDERYLALVASIDTRRSFPEDYTARDGFMVDGRIERFAFGGDRKGWRAQVDTALTLAVIPAWGHQLALGGTYGWSRRDDAPLQGEFTVGDNAGTGQPRGYDQAMATGPHLLSGSISYRFPLWRPFTGLSSAPVRLRQWTGEIFSDAAKISSDHPGGDGQWFRSYGAELRADMELSVVSMQPGLGVAKQRDGDKDTVAYFSLDFQW